MVVTVSTYTAFCRTTRRLFWLTQCNASARVSRSGTLQLTRDTISRPRNGSCGKVANQHPKHIQFVFIVLTALEHIPNPVRLWKKIVNFQSYHNGALLGAIEVIPLLVDLCLAPARLDRPERTKYILNEHRKAIPTRNEIHIAAGRLLKQEATSHSIKSVDGLPTRPSSIACVS